MAANNVSSLRVQVTGSTGGLSAALTNGSKQISRFRRHIEREAVRTRAASAGLLGGGRGAAVISNLGYGIEDAASQIGTAGLAGALRAAGNNLSAAAAALSPVAGIVVGIGTALGSVLLPRLLETEKATAKNAKAVDRWAAAFRDLDRWGAFRKFEEVERPRALREFARAPLAELDREIASARDRARELDVERRTLEGRRSAILRSYGLPEFLLERLGVPTSANPNPGMAAFSAQRRDNPGLRELDAGDFEKLNEINDRLRDVTDESVRVVRRLTDAEEARPRAALREFRETWDAGREAAARAREELQGLASDVLGTLDPEAARREAAQSLLDRRLADIDRLLPGAANLPRREALSAAAREAFRRDLRGGDGDRGLAGGFQFGSRDAVSALNRAVFSRSKADEETARNTKQLVSEIQGLRREAKDQRTEQFLAGPPL